MPARFPRRLLIDKVHIQRTSGSSVDERGIESNNWANVSTDVPCRFTLISETENRDGRHMLKLLIEFMNHLQVNITR